MICKKCGEKFLAYNKYCPHCGESIESLYDKNNSANSKYNNLKPYYREDFIKMDSNPEYKGRFNFVAFLFSWIWMITKKMYVGAVVYICITGLLISYVHYNFVLICALVMGFRANYMYYNYFNNKIYKLW